MDPEILQTQNEKALPNPQSLIDAGQLNLWIIQLIRPYVKGKVLEIWSGEGNVSALMVQNGLPLRISDPLHPTCESLKSKFEGEPLIKGVHRIDLHDPYFDTSYAKFLGKFDTVLSLNVMGKDTTAPAIFKNAKKLLWDRGRLILLLPVLTLPYEESNEGLEELHRWNRRYIKDLLGKDGKIFSFFALSKTPESYDSSSIEVDAHAQGKEPSLYRQHVPLFPLIEKNIVKSTGHFILATVRK